jgi:hypothetical protein
MSFFSAAYSSRHVKFADLGDGYMRGQHQVNITAVKKKFYHEPQLSNGCRRRFDDIPLSALSC